MAWRDSYETTQGKRYRISWRGADGKKVSKGGFVRAKDADAFKLDIEVKEQLGGLYQEQPQTFGEFFEAWVERYRPSVRPSSFKRRMETKAHLLELFPLTFDRITPALVEDIVMPVATESPRQAQYMLQTIKMVLRNAALRGQPVNPQVLTVTPPVYESRRKRFLTSEQVDDLAEGSTEALMLRFVALTGLRFVEVSGLTDGDVTLGARSIRVHRQITKSDAGIRTIPLTNEARRILREQRLARVPSVLLFPAPGGGQWGYSNFRTRVWKKNERVGDIDFHDLRHTFASLMIASGCHPKVLQTLMGHETISTTMDTYGHLYEDAGSVAMDALETYLRRDDGLEEGGATLA